MNILDLQQWQYFILAIFGGIILVILFFFARQSDWLVVGSKKEKHDKITEYPGGITEGKGRIPVFIVIISIAVFIWAVFYTFVVAVYGLKF